MASLLDSLPIARLEQLLEDFASVAEGHPDACEEKSGVVIEAFGRSERYSVATVRAVLEARVAAVRGELH